MVLTWAYGPYRHGVNPPELVTQLDPQVKAGAQQRRDGSWAAIMPTPSPARA
jgi:hypothetical protein